jgi:hypothetical protein
MKRRHAARRRTALIWAATLLGGLFVVLLIPSADSPSPAIAGGTPFLWKQDARWEELEDRFVDARRTGCDGLRRPIDSSFSALHGLIEMIERRSRSPEDSLFPALEECLFSLGPVLGACPERAIEYLTLVMRVRTVVKRQSEHWDISSPRTRSTLYRLVYGGRMAAEEVLLQSAPGVVPALVGGAFERSRAPQGLLLGVPVRSGDILVSRGGAPTSALIARGSDFPGNFSHVALVYVDSTTGEISIAESHIEKGVAIARVDDYLRDTKLRVMVLRLRSDLSRVVAEPLLPHRAATWMITRARLRHIPYDFAMESNDSSFMFCSEVVSQAFRTYGISLWAGASRISSPGVAAWLGAFGVRNFETQEPSDLEYDPQLRVIAEWRDPATLFNDHVDNAVIDAMLEGAEAGDRLGYAWYLLPFGRLAKFYSTVLNWFGGIGPVPEGMDAATALRHAGFDSRHMLIKRQVLDAAAEFRQQKGYVPPYWELVKMARGAAQHHPVR